MLRKSIYINNYQYLYELDTSVDIRKKLSIYRSVIPTENGYDTSIVFIGDENSVYPVFDSEDTYSEDINRMFAINNPFSDSFIYDELGKEKNIKCNRIRIYKSNAQTTDIDIILSAVVFLNNIKMFLLCKNIKKGKLSSENIIEYDNHQYTEYYEFDIPDIDDLYNSYYFENYLDIIQNDDMSTIKTDSGFLVSIKTFNYNYVDSKNTRKYIFDNNEQLSNSIYLTLFPFIVSSNLYMHDETYQISSDVFVKTNNKIELRSNLKFDENGKLKAYLEFDYPKEFVDLETAYQEINNVDFEEYEDIYYDEDDDNYFETDDHKQYQCVYKIEVANDLAFSSKSIIYESTPNTEDGTLTNKVENKWFDIPLYNDWKQYPGFIAFRFIFIDRYLGIVSTSNFTPITKESFKYLVRPSDNIYKLNIESMTEKINFIDNINCYIVKDENDETNNSTNQQFANKVILKPIYYRVEQLQNINIRENIVQNIAVNLNQFMTKVEMFKLIIDGMTINEYGRNDGYVIFKIDSSKLSNNTGKYDIMNQDDEYISSGDWSLF